jgi:hypothetical protein
MTDLPPFRFVGAQGAWVESQVDPRTQFNFQLLPTQPGPNVPQWPVSVCLIYAIYSLTLLCE